MAWYLAPALVRLRLEINETWPGRDRSSDGSIGDAAHSNRTSDHNPDPAAGGIVRAIDVDEDGIPAAAVVGQIIRDSRTAYVIYEGRIWENPAAFPGRGYWRKYTGANPHDHHFHLSVRRGPAWDSSTRPWGVAGVQLVSNPGASTGGTLPDIDVTPIPGIDQEDIMATLDDLRTVLTEVIRSEGVTGAGDLARLDAPMRTIVSEETTKVIRSEGVSGAGDLGRLVGALQGAGLGGGEKVDVAALADAIASELGPDLARTFLDALAARVAA